MGLKLRSLATFCVLNVATVANSNSTLNLELFSISNGTCQGSVLSPALFAVYLDDLLKELRSFGHGCYMGGLWVGAVGFVDDLLLLAPSRSAMEKMLNTCEKYALDLNLFFSTDPNPKKSKSKSIFMTGSRLRHVPKPVPLQLYGRDLPWVTSATHLWHELHEVANMDHECKCKKARFIDNSTTTRETFSFADPHQVLNAVQIYCYDLYRCWNTCVKLSSWEVHILSLLTIFLIVDTVPSDSRF